MWVGKKKYHFVVPVAFYVRNAIYNLGSPVLLGLPVVLTVRIFCTILNCVICVRVRASPWFHQGQQDDTTMPKVRSYLNSANE